MTEQEQLIKELHTALNDVTALFCASSGYDYNCVALALQALEKSGNLYNLPITVALAQKIEGFDAMIYRTIQEALQHDN